MSTAAIFWLFALMELVALLLVLVKSPKGKKPDAVGITFLGSIIAWLTLAIFMVVDAKSGARTVDLNALLKVLYAIAANTLVFSGMYAWSTRKTK